MIKFVLYNYTKTNTECFVERVKIQTWLEEHGCGFTSGMTGNVTGMQGMYDGLATELYYRIEFPDAEIANMFRLLFSSDHCVLYDKSPIQCITT